MVDRWGQTETCHCAHDKASHYFDRERPTPSYMACLCRGCDCTKYVNDREPKPWRMRKRSDTMPGLGDQ